jgi:broad specificity phosphatase PhoE
MAIEHLIFVRHGESRHLVDGLTGGWTDTSLTDRGRRQMAATAQHLDSLNLSDFAFFTSDLKRAQESASIIGEALALDIAPLSELREINNGDATGLTVGEAERIQRPAPAEPDPDWAAYAGAESLRALDARMRRALAELSEAGHSRVLLVGHGFSGAVLLKAWLGLPLMPYIAFDLAPASVSELSINSWSEPCINRLNCQYGSG